MTENKCLNFIDYLSMQPNLYFRGNRRYSTRFGAFMTVTSFSVISFFALIFIYQFLVKREINIIFYNQTFKLLDYDFDFNKKIFAFQLNDGYNLVDPRYLTIIPLLVQRNLTSNKINKIPMEYEYCQGGHNIDINYWNISDVKTVLADKYCIKPDKYDLRLSVNYTSNIKSYFNIYIQMCQNTTHNNNTCHSREKIINYLKVAPLSIIYYYHSFKVDLLDKDNPLQDSYYGQRSSIFYDFKYVFYEFIKQVYFNSDAGLFFDETLYSYNFGRNEVQSFLEINPASTEFSIKDTVFLMQFVASTDQKDVYIRNYSKFQTVMANIGGILKFILAISQLLTNFVTYNMFIFDMSNNFIDNKEPNEKKENKEVIKSVNLYVQTILNNSEFNKIKTEKHLELEDLSMKKNQLDFFQNLNSSKLNSMSLTEAIFPYFLCKKKKKLLANKGEDIIKRILSSDNIIKNFIDVEKIKHLILNENEIELFKFLKNPNIEEYLDILDSNKDWRRISLIMKDENQMKNQFTKGILNKILHLKK